MISLLVINCYFHLITAVPVACSLSMAAVAGGGAWAQRWHWGTVSLGVVTTIIIS